MPCPTMSSNDDSAEIKEAKEALSLNEELSSLHELSLIENEIISDFETAEEYLLYYSRIGDVDKLKKLFDLVDRENTTINVNVKGMQISSEILSTIRTLELEI